MRLIDADELNKGFKDSSMGLAMKKLIDMQPTAYDIDKVVNGLENIKTILTFYSQIDGSHHKAWCLDQIARIVYGEEYQDFIHHYEYIDDDGVEHDEPIYEWDCGIAP